MRKIKILLIALILVIGGVFCSNIYAADVERSLGAEMERPFTPAKYQYRVKSDESGNSVVYTVVKIFDDADRKSNNLLYSRPFYCLRGGVGFGASSTNPSADVSADAIKYIQTDKSEMHTNADEVIAKYKQLYNVDLNRTEQFNINGIDGKVEQKSVNIYNAILWILDESYLPRDIKNSENATVYSATEYKKELLDKAGVPTSEQEKITDDDLEVIQQLAIWYFVNYDEQVGNVKPTVSQNTMFPAKYLSIDGNNNFETSKINNLNRIYQYLVYGAIDNSSTYNTTGERTKTIEKSEFDKTQQLKITSNDNLGLNSYYQIGPVKIINSNINQRSGSSFVDATSIVLYDANGLPIDKDYKVLEEEESPDGPVGTSMYERYIYVFVNSSGERITSLQEGTEYYIRFYKAFEKGSKIIPFIKIEEQYDISKVTLRLTSSYSLAEANFLYAKANSSINQAVVELEKEKVSSTDEITTTEPKEFDLSLRKFITAIKRNGQNIQIEDRTPRLDLSKFNTIIDGINERAGDKITTATYIHPKDKLAVKTGDTVIYTIRIYNEGELDGTATEITDYLPAGLELVPASESQINTTYKWVAGEGNKITTNYLKDTNIKAYDSSKTTEESGWQKADTGDSGLYYADVQVECKVVVEVSAADQDLRNIAEITADNGDDRDSTPNNVNTNSYTPPADNSEYQEDDDDYEDLVLKTKSFDLALRKYIVAVEAQNLEGEASRIPNIDIEPLKGIEKTADYNHKKYPVEVKIGDVVTYRFSVYNEGEIDGNVYSIVDYLPEGLTFDVEANSNFIEYKESYTTEELEGKEYAYKKEGNKITILPLNSDKLFELTAFNGTTLDSKAVNVKFKVTAQESNDDQILTNVATMTYAAKGTDIADRDSSKDTFAVPSAEKLLEGLPGYKGKESNNDNLAQSDYYYEGQEDDDDFEKIIIKGKPFDLSLRKFITSIKRNGEEVEIGDRTPIINTETLISGTYNRNGQLENTATYEHSKEPLLVKQGDIITYTLRIYNEGKRDGYASEITDYIPEGLALIKDYKTTFNYGWKLSDNVNTDNIINLVGENGFYKTEEDVKNLKVEDFSGVTSLKDVKLIKGKEKITTSDLNDELIKAFDKNKTEAEEGWQKASTGEGGLYYKDVEVSFLVIAPNTYKDVLTNIAEISEDKDADKKEVTDRDSIPDDKKDPYTQSQEDDDDYEPVVLRYFDLALRKFITGVETNGKTTDVTSRIPQLSINEETGNIKYTHPKQEAPVAVANNDIVIYTLRVYNEGTLAGYAEEITDNIPEGLIFIPEHDINKQYEWKMFDKDGKVTESLEEVNTIKTDYLSKAKETENRINLINAFDSSKGITDTNPEYKDIKVAFRVIEQNTSDRIIVNSAQISEDSDDDDDSDPHKWNEGEDDQDKEYIYVKYFDLSLLKWVTQTIVTVDGKTTTETGFKPNTGLTETTGIRDNKENEPVAKVELDKKKLDKTTVKFVYKIRVTNEGEISGYATEVTDFIPEGLEFKAEDNKKHGWVKEGDNKVITRALENVLLEPGKSAELEIVFRWKNDKNNLGVKTNIAEITEDYNEYNSKDIDSTPENKKDPYEKEQEDDDDFALVVLSLKTGKGAAYTVLITTIIAMLAGGIYLIKKYVLTY